jgi:mono/diheme cytochrome c family protein
MADRAVRLRAISGFLVLALAGCDFPGRPDPDKRPVPADQVVDFLPLFQTNCSGCHGADGTQGPAPPLNDPLFLSIIPDAELERVIAQGRKGTSMAAFAHEHGGTLKPEQVKALVSGLKSTWKGPVALKPPAYLIERDAADASTEALERGRTAFARACAMCHGLDGKGDSSAAGPLHDPVFLGLISDQALRRIIITGRPDFGMPNFADGQGRSSPYSPLTPAEINDLIALLGSWRENPALPAIERSGAQP